MKYIWKTFLIILFFLSFAHCYGQDTKIQIESHFYTLKNVLNKRAGIIINLSITISESTKEYSKYVREIIESVNDLNQYMITSTSLDSISISELYQKNIHLSQKIAQLMENLVEMQKIKKNDEFVALIAQLESCENRIIVECWKYNEFCKKQNRIDLLFGKDNE